MAQYEIRFTRGGPVRLLVQHASDFAAVRSACTMVQPEDGLEVWSEDSCVYSRPENLLLRNPA